MQSCGDPALMRPRNMCALIIPLQMIMIIIKMLVGVTLFDKRVPIRQSIASQFMIAPK